MAKASDNPYPSIILTPGGAPSSPSAGQQRLYLDSGDSNKLKRKDSSGTVVTVEGGGGSLTVQDENSNVSTSVTQIDFQGAGVTATSGSGEVIVTIPGGTPGAWTSWTPTLTATTTNPTLGTGGTVQEGYYMQLGKLVIAWYSIQFGTTGLNVGSGEYRLSLPVAAVTTGTTVPMGHSSGFQPAAPCSIVRVSSTTVKFWITTTGGYITHSSVAGAGSQLWGNLTYEAA